MYHIIFDSNALDKHNFYTLYKVINGVAYGNRTISIRWHSDIATLLSYTKPNSVFSISIDQSWLKDSIWSGSELPTLETYPELFI